MIVHFTVNIVIIKDNKVLLEKRIDKEFWKVPGGHIDDNETPAETILRECEEELGLKVEFLLPISPENDKMKLQPNSISTYYEQVSRDSKLEEEHKNICFIYCVKAINEPTPKENQEIIWLTKKELEESNIHPVVKHICLLGFESLPK